MGWSHSSSAGYTLDKIEVACAKTREGTDCKSSNVYFVSGKHYFYEVTRRDQEDNGISGTISLCWKDEKGGELCREVGRFHIDGHGRLRGGHKLFQDAAKDTKCDVTRRWGM